MNIRRRRANNGKYARLSSRSTRWPILLFVLFIILGSFGCRRTTPPVSWTTSRTKGCDIERIWSHTLDGLADLTESELTTCEAACKRGDREACVGAGLMLYAGATVRKNTAEARKLFHQQCKANVGPGCISLWMTDMEVGRTMRGEAELMRACSKGENHACEALGRHFYLGVFDVNFASDVKSAVWYQTKACQAGSLSGCTGLGVLHLTGAGVPKDPKKAGKILQEQCQKGHALACYSLGMMYGDGLGVPKDPQKSLELLRSSCDGGAAKGCYEYGQMHWITEGSEYDYEAEPVNSEIALAYFHKACLGGIAEACHKLAFAYHYRANLVELDDARSMQYDEVACKRAVGEACHDLGERYYDGDGVESDGLRAAQYLESACSYGHAPSCNRMGQMYLEGAVVEKNEYLAKSRFTTACSAMEIDACYQVGRIYAYGVGGFKDEQWALHYLEKACKEEHSSACRELTFYYYYRTFPPATQDETERLYLETCHAGKMRACIDLGYMYRDIENGAMHAPAAVLFQKACDAGEHEGCLELGEAYFEGRGVTQDVAKGLKINMDSCHARYAWACYILGVRYRDGLGLTPDQYKAVLLLDEACPKVYQACRESEALRDRIKAEYEQANPKQ